MNSDDSVLLAEANERAQKVQRAANTKLILERRAVLIAFAAGILLIVIPIWRTWEVLAQAGFSWAPLSVIVGVCIVIWNVHRAASRSGYSNVD
jgi:hypothetical protein